MRAYQAPAFWNAFTSCVIRSMKLCIPFNTSSMSGSPEVLLPIHWATLEDNDDVESVEKEQSDITKSDISFGKIGH